MDEFGINRCEFAFFTISILLIFPQWLPSPEGSILDDCRTAFQPNHNSGTAVKLPRALQKKVVRNISWVFIDEFSIKCTLVINP